MRAPQCTDSWWGYGHPHVLCFVRAMVQVSPRAVEQGWADDLENVVATVRTRLTATKRAALFEVRRLRLRAWRLGGATAALLAGGAADARGGRDSGEGAPAACAASEYWCYNSILISCRECHFPSLVARVDVVR